MNYLMITVSIVFGIKYVICAFAPGAAGFIESLLTFFEDEVREHIRAKKCPFKDENIS